MIDGLSTMDFDGLRARREGLTAQAEQLSGELVKLDHGALLDSKRNELAALKNELVKLDNDNSATVPSRPFRWRTCALRWSGSWSRPSRTCWT